MWKIYSKRLEKFKHMHGPKKLLVVSFAVL